jgi:hypothetical protein
VELQHQTGFGDGSFDAEVDHETIRARHRNSYRRQPTSGSIVFDLVIDGQGNIVGETDIFGYSYEPGRRTDTCIPLVVDTNGKIDYGVGYDNDQYGETDLLGKRIANGTILEVWGPKYEQPLRISRVEVLVSESGIA